MSLTFDYSGKLIGVPQVDAQPLLVQDLVNAIRTEEATERGIAYDHILDATGKSDLGGGVLTGITAALRSTWKLNFAAGSYQATVDGGNLAEALDRVNNTGSPQVLLRSSAAATVVSTSGTTPPSTAAIATEVLDTQKLEDAGGGNAISMREMLRLLGAVLLGKVSGAGTATEVFRDALDQKPRVTATVDQTGNRSAITLDKS